MSDATDRERDEAFCAEVVRRGWVTEEQADEARRLHVAAIELGQASTLDAIFVRKGFLDSRQAVLARREVAATIGQTLRIGKYEIVGRLGEGGAGIVYRAYQTTLDREVALKVLSRDREEDEEYIKRFLREARVAVTLNHVNIVRGLDYGNADGYHYFAMELVEGESLLEVIKREGHLSEEDAIDYILQMVRALEHAAKYRIVHRDIKPENILVTQSGTAKLCDLGLAQPVIEGGNEDAAGRPMGTALYVAPEQIRSKGALDSRADIYSLGCTLFHALTGQPPYLGKSAREIVRKHLSAPVANPRDVELSISSGTASVVMKMMAKEPDDRYQSLEALDEDLDAVLEGRPPVNTITIGRKAAPLSAEKMEEVQARRASGTRPSAGGGKTGIIVGIVSVVALAGVGAFIFMRPKTEPEPTPPPVVVTKTPTEPQGPTLEERMQEAREKAATEALTATESIATEEGELTEAHFEALRTVVAEHDGTAGGRLAAERLKDLGARRKAVIAGELEERQKRSATALSEGHLGRAVAAWDNLPAIWEGTAAADEAARAVASIRDRAGEEFTTAKDLVTRALDKGDEDAEQRARGSLEMLATSGLEDVAGPAALELERMESVLRERVERLRAAESAWDRIATEALLASAAGAAKGTAVLDREAALLVPVADRVERLRDSLAARDDFLDAAIQAFTDASAASEPIKLRAPDRPRGTVSGRAAGVGPDGFRIQRGPSVETVRPEEIHPEDIAALAWKRLGTGGAREHRGAAVYFLSTGTFEAALREAEALELLEAVDDARRVRDLLETVRRASRERADRVLRDAEIMVAQRRFDEARQAFAEAVSLCDGYARTLWKQGAFLLSQDPRSEQAAMALEAAAALGPEDPEAWVHIGEVRRRDGSIDEALTAFERYLEEAPADHPLRESVRVLLTEVRASAAAAAAEGARTEAARAYRRDEFTESERLWRRVLQYLPDDPEATYFLGKSLLAQGRSVDAYLNLRRYLALDPSGSRARDAKETTREMEKRLQESGVANRKHNEAAGLAQQGRWRDAIAVYGEALDLAPLSAPIHADRAAVLLNVYYQDGKQEDLAQAAWDLEVALAMNERFGHAWTQLSIVRYLQEDWEAAVEAGTRAMAHDPLSGDACEMLARACNKVGRWPQAEAAADEGINRDPRARLYIARAEARLGLGKFAEARADLDTAALEFELKSDEKSDRAEILGRVIKAEKAAE